MGNGTHEPVEEHTQLDGSLRYCVTDAGRPKRYAIKQQHRFRLPRVFTIFCHGTGGHRYGRCKELVTELHSAYWDRGTTEAETDFYRKHYQKSFLILDGPGTTDMWRSEAGGELGLQGPPHPMPGDFQPCILDKPLKPHRRSPDRTPVNRVSEMMSLPGKHRGDIMGDGWNDNVAHALFVLNGLLEKDEFPEVVNLIGWSRGAVTTLKLASAIQELFVDGQPYKVPKTYEKEDCGGKDVVLVEAPKKKVPKEKIRVNIFAVDPVPGRFGKSGTWGGSKQDEEILPPAETDYQRLPEIVKKCVISLAMDERRAGFAPICAGWTGNEKLLYDAAKSKVVWLPFPGIHRTQLRMEPKDPVEKHDKPPVRAKLTAVPHLLWDLAWRFLTSNGTVFKRDLLAEAKFGGGQLSLAQVVDLYANVMLLREEYHRARNQDSGIGQKLGMDWKWRTFTGYRAFGKDKKHEVPADKLFTKRLEHYVKYPGFFVNLHHEACFKKAHPRLYDFLTKTTRVIDDGATFVSGEGMAQQNHWGGDWGHHCVFKDAGVIEEMEKIAKTSHTWLLLGRSGIHFDANLRVGGSGPVYWVYYDPALESDWRARCNFHRGSDLGHPLVGEPGAAPPRFRPSPDLIGEIGLLDYPEEAPAEQAPEDTGTEEETVTEPDVA